MLNGTPANLYPDIAVIADEVTLTIAAEKLLRVNERVEYTGNGSTGVLVQMRVDDALLLSRVLLDGRTEPSLIKTKYLVPSDSVASVAEEMHPLDTLENTIAHEDLTDGMKIPAIMRAIALAQIFAAREAERQGDILERIAQHFGVK